jgi:hypothetical protein
VPYTVNCNPAPLTFTIRPKFDWQILVSIPWVCFVGYQVFFLRFRSDNLSEIVIVVAISLAALASFIRRERIEIYSEQMVWRKTYFGITRSNAAPLADVLGAEWNEGEQRGRHGKGPDYVEFYLPNGSVKACFGFTFDDFERMREDIRTMFPQLINRWGQATVRSKDFTLLNLS